MNNVSLVGRTTKDIESKYTPSGKAVAKFSLAIGKTYMKNGEKVEEVVFIEVQCWDKVAENTVKYVLRGHKVGVSGSLKMDRWEQPDGTKRSKIYVVAQQVEFLETKPKNDNNDDNNNGWDE